MQHEFVRIDPDSGEITERTPLRHAVSALTRSGASWLFVERPVHIRDARHGFVRVHPLEPRILELTPGTPDVEEPR